MARMVKCPGCGAELTVNYQETHRFVDEAKVRRVDAFKDIAMKGMELHEKKQEQEREEAEKNRRMMPVYIGLMIAIPVIAGIILKFFG